MEKEDRIKILQKVDLFSSFSNADLAVFAESIAEVHCQPGETLLEEGTEGDDFFVLLQGQLIVYKGKRILTEILPVDYVGEMAIIDVKPRSATVKACKQCQLLRIPAPLFTGFLASNPQALQAIMKILSQRLRHDNELIVREFDQINVLVHDIKNILSLFLFLDNFPVEDKKMEEKYLHYMKTARRHISSLVGQALANVKNLVMPDDLVRNSFTRLVAEMKESDFVTQQDLCDKHILIDLPENLPEFCFSRLQIRLVLLNLLINAAQASSSGAEIELIAHVEGNALVIEVKDHGCGITNEIGGRIFNAHFTTKATGNGLGLFSCKQIVEQKHGGSISFFSSPLSGTIFKVVLPLTGVEFSVSQ